MEDEQVFIHSWARKSTLIDKDQRRWQKSSRFQETFTILTTQASFAHPTLSIQPNHLKMGSKRKRQVQESSTAAPAAKKQQKETKKAKAAKEAPLRPTVTEIEPISFLDNPRGADLKREVELYDLLGSEDANERLLAANAIISGLLGTDSGADGVEVDTLQRHMERRLFRGLASGRKGARLGYSVVITELLGQLFGGAALADPGARYQEVNFEQCLNWLVEKTKPEGDLSGQEERDHWLGLLFGLQSFVRARICFGGEGDGRWSRVLGELLSLAVRKSWIREECGWVIVEAVQQMNQAEAEITLEKLLEAGLASSPEGVGIWLTAKHKFPKMKTPRKPWGDNGEPLNNLQNLAKALKESSSKDDEGAAKQTGNWNPKIHFAWDLILAQYLKKGAGEGTEFKQFWKVVVDGMLKLVFTMTTANQTDRQPILCFCLSRAQILGLPPLPEDFDRSRRTQGAYSTSLQRKPYPMPR